MRSAHAAYAAVAIGIMVSLSFSAEVSAFGFEDAPDIPRRTGEYAWSREASGARVETARLVADIGKAILTTGSVPDADELSLCEYLELG